MYVIHHRRKRMLQKPFRYSTSLVSTFFGEDTAKLVCWNIKLTASRVQTWRFSNRHAGKSAYLRSRQVFGFNQMHTKTKRA